MITGVLAKYWSDSHVSEDFDQALRLQIAGFTIRLASYHNGDFKEGVSLTVFDELARWEKYTYGCNELLFHPFHKWLYKGPFTPLLWKLLRSNLKSSSKLTILGYVFTYYAMAAALPFCLINYFLTGWIPDLLGSLLSGFFQNYDHLTCGLQLDCTFSPNPCEHAHTKIF